MNKELQKRVKTSIFLSLLLTSMYLYTFIMFISLLIIAIVTWVEFYGLITKIFSKNNFKNKIFKFVYKLFALIYLSLLVFGVLFVVTQKIDTKILILYSIIISIASDIGGMVFGKFFKGKKLTKISPKKTISGSIGAFFFSILLIFFFNKNLSNYPLIGVLCFTVAVSFISQIGDLFISFLKRKAKVKDTSDILPGHGGFLDRIDGIIFALPFGIFLSNFLI